MTQKPKAPAVFALIPALYTAALWFYPIAPGGLGNLAAFAAWAFAGFSLFLVVMSMFMPDVEGKYRPTPPAAKLAIRVGVWGGAVWLVYHGAFALAALVAIVIGLGSFVSYAKKQARTSA